MVIKKESAMRALTTFIDNKNRYAALFKGQRTEPLYEVQTAAGRKRVAEMIDCALSPENLSCDGELPRAEVNRRYRELTAAARDLVKLDPTVAQYMYEFG
jgi:hypothetical protein